MRVRQTVRKVGLIALVGILWGSAADAQDLDELLGGAEEAEEQEPGVQEDDEREAEERPEPEARPESQTRPPPRRKIEEIVVTARKRAERLMDAPTTITAFKGEDLARRGITDLEELSRVTPQLHVLEGSSGAGGTLSMRGIASSANSAGFDSSVAVNIDSIHFSRSNILMQGFFDVDRVEVLKGPQALFFGKNSPAGVVSIKTADPGPEVERILRLSSGFLAEEQEAEAILSGPITDSFGARLALRGSFIKGYIENVAGPTTDPGTLQPVPAPERRDYPGRFGFLGRLTLQYEPTDYFDATIKVSGSRRDGGNTEGFELTHCDPGLGHAQTDPDEPCQADRKIRQNPLPPSFAATEDLWNRKDGEIFKLFASWTPSMEVNYDLGNVLLTSVSGFQHHDTQMMGDFLFTGSYPGVSAENQSFDAFSQELRFLTKFDLPLNFTGGIFYEQSHLDFRNLPRIFPRRADPTTGRHVSWDRRSETDGRTWSGYGQAIWDVFDRLTLESGARLTHETKDSFAVHDYVHPAEEGIFWRQAGEPLKGVFSDFDVSPEVTVSWWPTVWEHADVMLYGAFKQGFKSGGFNNSAILTTETTVEDVLFDSERASGFEGGIKSSWFGRSLEFNLVGYSYDYENLQIQFFDASAINFIVRNATAVDTNGFETQVRWLPPFVEGLTLQSALSFNRSRFGEFIQDCYGGQSFEDGCNLDENGEPTEPPGERQDLSGTVRALAPEWDGNFGFGYRYPFPYPLPWLGEVEAGLDANFQVSDHFLTNPLGRRIFQSGFVRSDATFQLSAPDKSWDLSLIGTNLSDEFITFATSDAPLSGQNTGQPEETTLLADQITTANRPREIALQLTWRF